MNPPSDPTPTPDEIAQASQTIAQTPATLPLKRPTPIFIEATLPEPSPEPPQPGNASMPTGNKPVPTGNDLIPTGNASIPTDIDPIPTGNDVIPTGNGSFQADNEPLQTANEPFATPAPLPSVEFSPPPGAPFQSSLTLQLVSSAPDTEIRYALNASDVGADGLLYDPAQKIFLAQSTSVAARAIVGGRMGPLSSAEFGIVQPAWQKIEPLDQSDPTPHELGEQCALEGLWRLAAASVRGKLHAHRGLWREDSLAYGLAPASDGSYAISVVSDGAGSANLSRVGSKLLCNVALEHLKSALSQFAPLASDQSTLVSRDLPLLRTILVEAASLALQKLREEAATRGKPLGDFSSTLLILVRRDWNGSQLCAALQAGDGAIALWDDDGTLTSLGEADHGQHSSETKFLTTSGMEGELPARVKFSIRPRLRAALIMSDGIADDFFPETARFPDLIGQILPLVEADAEASGAALLNWMRYEKKGSSDDRAMIISWRQVTPEAQIEVAADATLDALTNATPAATLATNEAASAAETPSAIAETPPAVAVSPSELAVSPSEAAVSPSGTAAEPKIVPVTLPETILVPMASSGATETAGATEITGAAETGVAPQLAVAAPEASSDATATVHVVSEAASGAGEMRDGEQ